MASDEHVKLLKQGTEAWNEWRACNPDVRPDLRDANFETDIHTYETMYDTPEFYGLDLRGADLHAISARNSGFTNCVFDGSQIDFSDLCFSHFHDCSFVGVSMRVTRIGSASFINCRFENSDLGYCSAEETDFSGSQIVDSSLNNMSMVKTNFSDALIERTSVYGASAWDLVLDGSTQRDISVSDDGNMLTVDNLEIAQFIHLLVRNSEIRRVIDTITSKVVLILGRFTPERKAILDELRERLRQRDYVPVLFDFDGPESRNLTEAVSTLAHLSRFVIADVTEPRSIPHELSQIVPNLPSVPVQPILAAGQSTFEMIGHFDAYPWFLAIQEYEGEELGQIADSIVSACESALGDADSD